MATTKKNNKVNENATRVVCPNCGAEFEIPEHETTAKNVTVIGADSNLGTVYLKLKDRQEQLKTAGIDVTKYFSMKTPGGVEKLMKWDGDTPVPVTSDDPVMRLIIEGGTVPNRDLFRRWVMAQVFEGLTFSLGSHKGFTDWVHWKGYEYSWKMAVEEFRVQAKLSKKDPENYNGRNRWFNKSVAVAMAYDYIEKLKDNLNSRKRHKCKGVPYIKVNGKNVFVDDIHSKIVSPLITMYLKLKSSATNTPDKLYTEFKRFYAARTVLPWEERAADAWMDAYKGAGAYYTMQNMIRFHGCLVRDDKGRILSKDKSLKYLEDKADEYKSEGWRLFGVMKKLIEDNGIDIKAKRASWREAKTKNRLGW